MKFIKPGAAAFIAGANVQSEPHQKKKPQKAVLSLPWADSNPRIKVGFNLRLPEPLHKKLLYLSSENTSAHSICLTAIEKAVAEMLAKKT